MNSQTLSIIIPVRDGGETFKALLQRLPELKTPTGRDIETVVGYQESSDPDDTTLATIEAAGVQHVHCLTLGPSANRNAAVAKSTGSLLALIDADAEPMADDFFVKAVEHFERNPSAAALGGPIVLHPSQRFNPIAIADHYACWFLWHRYRPAGDALFQPTANLWVRRAAFEAAGGFDESLRVFEDFAFEEKLKANGGEILFFPDIAIYHHSRDVLLESWRHSWSWGLPMRSQFLDRLYPASYLLTRNPKLFWLNWPILFLRRLLIVLIQSVRESPLKTLYCLPFLVATVLAWSIAAVVGE